MPIVSSIIQATHTQKDNRRWVIELHIDHVGVRYLRHYLAGILDNLDTALAAYAIVLASNINLAEIAKNIAFIVADGSLALVTFVYSTMAENRSALREAYRNSTRVEAVMIGDFLSSLTDGQLQTIFGMTTGQVTTLRTNRLTPAASLAASIRATTGQ